MRGRQQTEFSRVFECDDSIDVLVRALRSGAAHDGVSEEMIACAESAPGAASIGVDVAMISGKVCRPSRLVLPYNSYQRRCSNTSPHPHIVHRTTHTCHDTRAQRGPSGTAGTAARHRTHACKAATEASGAVAGAGVVRRSAERRRKAARWRADELSSSAWHEGRCGVRRAGRAAARGSGRASPTASPLRPRR